VLCQWKWHDRKIAKSASQGNCGAPQNMTHRLVPVLRSRSSTSFRIRSSESGNSTNHAGGTLSAKRWSFGSVHRARGSFDQCNSDSSGLHTISLRGESDKAGVVCGTSSPTLCLWIFTVHYRAYLFYWNVHKFCDILCT